MYSAQTSNKHCNGKEATVNKALDGSTYPGQKLVHSVFGKINYGGLKHNSLYMGLVLPSGVLQSLIRVPFYKTFYVCNLQMFVHGRSFQSGLMLLGKARSLVRGLYHKTNYARH
jgi:hypothetical protein